MLASAAQRRRRREPPRVSATGEEIRPLTSDECATFLEASRGERLEALYMLAVHCGLREGELLALRWEDVISRPPSPPCSCGAPSHAERTGEGGSWARAPSPARVGGCV